MSPEYSLSEAGLFTLEELLDFQNHELEKGRTVEKIWITERQANHLANTFADIKQIKTGMKLVDFWNAPKVPITMESLNGIEIGIELKPTPYNEDKEWVRTSSSDNDTGTGKLPHVNPPTHPKGLAYTPPSPAVHIDLPTPVTPETKETIDQLLDQTFAYGVDWTEYKDKSEHDHDTSMFAAKIKAQQKQALKKAIESYITQRELQSQIKILEKAHRLDGQMDYDNETDEYIDTLIDSLKAQLGESNDI